MNHKHAIEIVCYNGTSLNLGTSDTLYFSSKTELCQCFQTFQLYVTFDKTGEKQQSEEIQPAECLSGLDRVMVGSDSIQVTGSEDWRLEIRVSQNDSPIGTYIKDFNEKYVMIPQLKPQKNYKLEIRESTEFSTSNWKSFHGKNVMFRTEKPFTHIIPPISSLKKCQLDHKTLVFVFGEVGSGKSSVSNTMKSKLSEYHDPSFAPAGPSQQSYTQSAEFKEFVYPDKNLNMVLIDNVGLEG